MVVDIDNNIVKGASGFSIRFNVLLDRAGFPEKGRSLQLAKRFGVSKHGARKWLKEGAIPRNLREMVNELRLDLENPPSLATLMLWLQEDKSINDPFEAQQTSTQVNHLLLSSIYSSVHFIARDLELAIENLPQETLNHIYDTILQACISQHSEKPDEVLIRNLLVLLKSKT